MDGSELKSDSGYILDHQFKGGKLGVLAFSQKEIVFSDLQYQCDGEFPLSLFSLTKFLIYGLLILCTLDRANSQFYEPMPFLFPFEGRF